MWRKTVPIIAVTLGGAACSLHSGASHGSFGAHEAVELDSAVAILHVVPPEYPATALADRLEGQVLVDVLVDTTGKVQDAAVCQSLRSDADSAALEAARAWRFSVPTVHGKPVTTGVHLCIRFVLPKQTRKE